MEWINANIVFVMLHIIGVAVGAGAAFTGDFIFLSSVKDRVISKEESRVMDMVGRLVWVGLALLILSGIGLVWLRPEIFLRSQKFWAKMTVVGVIAANGLVFHFSHRKTFKRNIGVEFSKTNELIKKRLGIVMSGALSVVSWIYAIILGVLARTPFSYVEFVGVYLVLVAVAFVGAFVLKDRILSDG